MAQKQVKIGDMKDVEEHKSEIIQSEGETPEDLKKRKSVIGLGMRRQFSFREARKDDKKKNDRIKTYKEFLEDDVKPFRFLSTHFPHYQDHYQYPGYVPFVKRNISETMLAAGWDEKADNERLRKGMIAERLKRRKKVSKAGIKLPRDQAKINPLKFDDAMILGETVVRRLSGKNPRYAQPLYQFHYYYGEYREMVKPCDDHQNIQRLSSGLVHVDSIEAQWQIEEEEAPPDLIESESSTEVEEEEEGEEESSEEEIIEPLVVEEQKEEEEAKEEGGEEQAAGEEEAVTAEGGEEEEVADEESGGKKASQGETPLEIQEKLKLLEDEPPIRFRRSKKLFNLFNFTDRGIQGEVTMTGEKTSQTVPVPMGNLNKYICNYIVYDVYQKDVAAREERARKEKLEAEMGETEEPSIGDFDEESDDESSNTKSFTKESAHQARILERMVVQNTLFDYTADMKFYEDPIDDYNKEEGSLLPLWTFKRSEFQGLSVTSIQFSPVNPDIFGVTHGSFDFTAKSEKGYISVYSIKDPLNPEYKRECKTGVTCFNYHPGMESYVAYATYDGAVHCCDTREPPEDEESGLHSHPEERHQAFIWKVMWDPSLEELMFYTISADGLFLKWNVRNFIVVRSVALSLQYPPEMDIPYLTNPFPFLSEITEPKQMQAIATTMELDPNSNENVFVGTSDGMVLKCCLRYTTDYLFVYHSHTLPVSRIHFNVFMKTLFVTASEDRKINIHEEGRKKPIYTFVQSNGVVDVMWAPHSSTVFALLTSDCRISVYDLNVSSTKPMCHQFLLWKYGKTTLTKLIFHPTRPIIFVGDSSGTIVSLKLSPNLRIKPKKQKRQKPMDPFLMELTKLENSLNKTREPDEYPLPEDDPKALVIIESDSDEEDTVRIGTRVYKVPPPDDKSDTSRLVKRRVFEKYHEIKKLK